MADVITGRSTALPEGFIHALLTPFDRAGRFDETVYSELVDFHVRHRADGLSVALHYGESPSLTLDERKMASKIAVDVAAGRTPVYVHAAGARVENQIEIAQHAESCGAYAIVAPPPYARDLSEQEIIAHYERLAGACGIQLLAYNVIAPSAAPMTAPTIAELARRIPRFVGVKNAHIDIEYVNSIIEAVAPIRSSVIMVNGSELFLPMYALGVRTINSLMACVAPRAVRELWLSCKENRIDEMKAAQLKVAKLLRILMPAYPAQIKVGMEIMGRPVGYVREPHPAVPTETYKAIEMSLSKLGILESEPHGWKL